MAPASVPGLDPVEGKRLTSATRTLLGQLLRDAYARLPSAASAPPAELSDLLDQLTSALSAHAKRDERTFKAELEALIPSLYRFAKSLTKRQPQADDLVQDTLLRAWRARERFIVGTNLGSWLFTIMRNQFYSGARRGKLEVNVGGEVWGNGTAIVADQLDNLDVQDVQRALLTLTQPMREALLLVTVEGLTYEQAAQAMKCEIGTVKSRVCRARAQLVQQLGFGASELGADHVMLSVVSGQGTPAQD